jgi:NAD(P)-dependent dehydrogenase (short-subunit alcohol dehydrogenase family)
LRALGGLDLLLLNAGISMNSRFEDVQDPALFRQLIETNYLGPVWLTAATLPALKASHGRIVVVSSLAGTVGLPTRTGYAASKHALHGFFDSLRPELAGAGVGVTIVCPGAVDTPIREATAAGGRGSAVGDEAAGKMMSAAECARGILDAARAGKRQVLMTLSGKLSPWVKLLVPGLIDRVLVKRLGL